MSHEDTRSCAGCGSGAEGLVDPRTAGIARRTFLAQTGLLAAAALLASCGMSNDVSTAPTLNGPTTIKLSDYPALANVGGVALVTIASSPFAVVRTSSTSFVALSRYCPHQGTVVNTSGNGFLCPNHGAQFDATGHWIGGQPTNNMQSYTATYDAAAGTVTVS